MKTVTMITAILLVVPCMALAQDFCKGDFNYNGSVAAEDVTTFLEHFGRNPFNDACPPDGPSPVPKTGQRTSYATGDDGDLERGVDLVTPRFTDNGNGTVTDNQTGLIWLKNANCFGQRIWNNALSDCNGLTAGYCGLTDGSSAGDWRLPNVNELFSLIDRSRTDPALPTGHPFINIQFYLYWSSTTYAIGTIDAWWVSMLNGDMGFDYKSTYNYVWPVRGGH